MRLKREQERLAQQAGAAPKEAAAGQAEISCIKGKALLILKNFIEGLRKMFRK